MKKIIRIAKLELNILFYSPIAWFLLIIFLFQCGMVYTQGIKGLQVVQDLGGFRLNYLESLTANIFIDRNSGLYTSVISKFYLYFPLLTMGLISREINSGTIKLLYSSPIKVREIIFGKFLAMVVYSLLMIAVLALFAMAGMITIKSADTGLILSGLLGLFLLLCTYSAIGLFVSCLTSYQVVAALSTLVLLGLLYYIGTLWQEYDFIRDLTFFLSISGRTENMLHGLIGTKDVLYFLVIIYMFLGLSIYKLRAGMESRSAWIRVGRYGFIFVSSLAIGYLSSRPGFIGYWDTTATKTNTLTPNVQKILAETKGAPLEVTSYINLLESHYWWGAPAMRNFDLARWEPYTRFKPDIRFKYVYYYDSVFDQYFLKDNQGSTIPQVAQKFAKNIGVDLANFLTPQQIRSMVNLRPEDNRYVMQLKYKDRSTFLRIYDDQLAFPGETETSAAVKRMLTKLPKIAFLTGELERSIDKAGDRDYKTLTNKKVARYSLINQGFDVDTLSLKDQEVPSDIAALVIADPRMDFAPEVLVRIQKYIDNGGNLLIAGEPGKQSVLNPLLRSLGVQIREGIVIQQSRDNAPTLILSYLTGTAAHFSKAMATAFADSGKVSMPGAAALSYTVNGSFDIKPLLMTDSRLSWNKTGTFTSDSAEIIYSGAAGDERGPLPTALMLTRRVKGKEQRIVVTGDADFLSNGELRRIQNLQTSNFVFNTGIFGWFTYGEFPIDTSRPKSKDNRVNLTDKGAVAWKIFFLGLLPGLLLIFGMVLLIRRKRK